MQLTRERIVGAAIELIEREGVDAVSMRRIAAELGSGAMSLYNHVPSKSALLDAVAEQVMSGIDFRSEPGASWQDQVRTQARAFRQIARAYPRCTLVVVSRHRTSAAGMRPIEHALATLHGAGFGGTSAVRIVRAFVAYIVGSLLREVGVSPSLADPQEQGGGEGERAGADGRLPPDEFPQVLSLSAELAAKDPDADFEFGLDLLVQAIGALLPAGRPSGH
jgi:AcrR family transcriptional regulator